jgi:hypothetical protein
VNKLISRGKIVIPEAPLQERAFSIKSFSQISSIVLANITTLILSTPTSGQVKLLRGDEEMRRA